ncbi:MAG: peptidyl-prolyl cis-trans isomerase [Nannocystis sp.]|nr:peptidyl-prolyl cis-trans isomerase [Nannocystis sp.]MBA3546917.1 peptidyl-prolyl cis-trans isomerase [Nannocystis sp.]
MLRLTLALGLLAAGPLLAASPAMAGVLLDRVVAVVNDEVILMSELEVAVRSSEKLQARVQALGPNATQQQVDQAIREERSHTLDELVKSSLVKKEAIRFQIEVSEGDIERYLQNLAQANGFKSVAELRKAVEESGEYGAWSDYKQDIRDQLIVYKTTQSLANFAVTDAQVREQYRKMTRGEASKVEVERFLFTPEEATAPARDEAYSKAQVTARRLRSGEAVDTVAAELKMAGQTRKTIGRGEVAPAVEDAIFAAAQGGVIGPLETGQGFLVMKIVQHMTSDVLSFEQAKDNIRGQLEEEAFNKAAEDFRNGLLAKAHVDIRL